MGTLLGSSHISSPSLSKSQRSPPQSCKLGITPYPSAPIISNLQVFWLKSWSRSAWSVFFMVGQLSPSFFPSPSSQSLSLKKHPVATFGQVPSFVPSLQMHFPAVSFLSPGAHPVGSVGGTGVLPVLQLSTWQLMVVFDSQQSWLLPHPASLLQTLQFSPVSILLLPQTAVPLLLLIFMRLDDFACAAVVAIVTVK